MVPEVEAKYRRLGFKPAGLGLNLRIGNVEMVAVEHPLKGVAVIFTSITPRSASQFDIGVATACPIDQIAGVIYANFARNFSEDAAACRQHFERLGVLVFQ